MRITSTGYRKLVGSTPGTLAPGLFSANSLLSWTCILGLYTICLFYLLGLPPRLPTFGLLRGSYTSTEFGTRDVRHLVLHREARSGASLSTKVAPRTLLFLVLSNDEESWGYENGRRRSLQDHLSLVLSTGWHARHMSLGVLTSSKTEFELYSSQLKEFMSGHDVSRITLILNSGYDDVKMERNNTIRHSWTVQKERRRLVARLRNYLMYSALDAEDGILWLDSDIYDMSPGLVQQMVGISKPIVTARCSQDQDINYDRNAWVGPRIAPTPEQLQEMANEGIFVPNSTADTKYLSDFMDSTDPVQLDSVGGTSLYLDASVVRQGVNFPPYYVVGTSWTTPEGWDGIETEGLGYVARTLGYSCWGLTGPWETKHVNESAVIPADNVSGTEYHHFD